MKTSSRIILENIKIDKVTVWEGGNSADGKTSTSNFISGMYKAVPPLQEMFNMAGMQLPDYLKGKDLRDLSTNVDDTDSNEGSTDTREKY